MKGGFTLPGVHSPVDGSLHKWTVDDNGLGPKTSHACIYDLLVPCGRLSSRTLVYTTQIILPGNFGFGQTMVRFLPELISSHGDVTAPNR